MNREASSSRFPNGGVGQHYSGGDYSSGDYSGGDLLL